MSWYSDGERFDEYDPPQCKYCDREVTPEQCYKCWQFIIEEEG